METGSTSTTNRLSETMAAENNGNKLVKSSKPDGLFKGRKKAEILQDKSFRKNLDRIIISRSNSENVAIDNSVTEYGEKAWTHGNDVTAVPSKIQHRSKSMMVTPDVPLPTDPVMLIGHDEDRDAQFNDQDEEETLKTGNTVILNGSAKKSRIPEQERYVNLKARVKQLREENHRLSRKLQNEAEISLQLKEENKILLDELKEKCGPDVISYLEAQNPDQCTQSNDDQN